MPNLEPIALEGRGYELRLVGPQSVIWPNPSVKVQTYALLNQPALVARKLPMTNDPNSPDMVSGSWTERLGDAGEATLTFPNKEASNGVPWRNRFDSSGRNQWLEIWNENYLDFVGYVEKPDLKRDQIEVGLRGPWFALKAAYERDWVVVQAPRDVIERATQLWVPATVDNFPPGALNAQWTAFTDGLFNPSATIAPSGGLFLFVPGSAGDDAGVTSSVVTLGASTRTWQASCNVLWSAITTSVLIFQVWETPTNYAYEITLGNGTAFFGVHDAPVPGNISQLSVPTESGYSLMLESDGEWVRAFVNGQFIGGCRRVGSTTNGTTQLRTQIALESNGVATSATVTGILVESLQPFLQRGSDKGDYVLPGTAVTYPNGGLHARYYNNGDLQSDTNRNVKIHHPSRSQIFAGNDASEYANQQDATVNHQQNPQPGAASSSWSAIWFGAIWLPLSRGDFVLSIATPAGGNSGVRLWIGKTQWGDQLVEHFTFQANNTYNFTVSATTLAGTLSYGGGSVHRDGWYPIKIEYAVDGTALTAPALNFVTVPGGGSYTDPGGSSIASGTNNMVVPATSLSPLGCVDQRHQGVSHFDLVQTTALASGYQVSAEPYQLETLGLDSPTGCFPAQLAPRIREGHDVDVVLEPDDTPRAEGLLSYSNTLDAADIVTSLQGNGAGFQSGTTGQLQALVYDPASLRAALFDIQGWQDYSEASFLPLLQGLLNAQLGLRLSPWQVVAGDPIGHPRLAQNWPLPAALAPLRWRPGDGLRVYARDVNVIDTAPRQLLLVTRQIHPNGATGTQVGFAARPRSAQFALKQTMTQATRWQRNSQRRFAALTGSYEIVTLTAGATDSGASQIILLPSDLISAATLRVVLNSGAVSFHVLVNGVDATTNLNGPWTSVPTQIDLSSVALPDANCRLFVQLKNNGGVNSTFHYQLLVDVIM